MKNFLKENWFKISITTIALLVGLSVIYYLLIFVPNKEASILEVQKQQVQEQTIPSMDKNQSYKSLQELNQESQAVDINQSQSGDVLCNGKRWVACPTGQQFYCPSSGDATCYVPQDNTKQSSSQYKLSCLQKMTSGISTPKKKPKTDAEIRQYNDSVGVNQEMTSNAIEYCDCSDPGMSAEAQQLCHLKYSVNNLQK